MTLRSKLIRLAHTRPELRAEILPLLKRAKDLTEISNVREMGGLTGPVTLTSRGEENIYFTDGEGGDYFFKYDGRPADEKKILRYLKSAGRSYGGDPRWMRTKYPAVDSEGQSVAKGTEVLYWPSTKTIMTGEKAQDSWKKFLSEKGDEEGNPYARSASAPTGLKDPTLDERKDLVRWHVHGLTQAKQTLAEVAKRIKNSEKASPGDLHMLLNLLNVVQNSVGTARYDLGKALGIHVNVK